MTGHPIRRLRAILIAEIIGAVITAFNNLANGFTGGFFREPPLLLRWGQNIQRTAHHIQRAGNVIGGTDERDPFGDRERFVVAAAV